MDEAIKFSTLLAIKLKARTVMGRGDKILRCNPRSTLRLGGSEKIRAKIIHEMENKIFIRGSIRSTKYIYEVNIRSI